MTAFGSSAKLLSAWIAYASAFALLIGPSPAPAEIVIHEPGIAGGDAVITMEHRCRTDVNNDSITNIDDLFEILTNRGPCE